MRPPFVPYLQMLHSCDVDKNHVEKIFLIIAFCELTVYTLALWISSTVENSDVLLSFRTT